MNRDELNTIQRQALARAAAGLDDLRAEFESRYAGASDHALLAEYTHRVHEMLDMLVPPPPVPGVR